MGHINVNLSIFAGTYAPTKTRTNKQTNEYIKRQTNDYTNKNAQTNSQTNTITNTQTNTQTTSASTETRSTQQRITQKRPEGSTSQLSTVWWFSPEEILKASDTDNQCLHRLAEAPRARFHSSTKAESVQHRITQKRSETKPRFDL